MSEKNKNHLSYIKEVESAVVKTAKNVGLNGDKKRQAYYGTKNLVLGLSVPEQRELLKQGYSFSKLPLNEQIIIWQSVLHHSKFHESKAQALFWLSDIKDIRFLMESWDVIQTWTQVVDSWDASDNLSSVYVRILEEGEQIVYPTLLKWNKSENPWERRQSVVSLLYYSSARKKTLGHKKILCLIEELIHDPDKFVQKGVGWALRESYSVHPEVTTKFICKHATVISAIAFSAASEKWPRTFSDEIKEIRSDNRKKKSA